MNIFNKAQKDVASQSTKTEKSVHTLDDAFRAISPSTLSAVAGVTALIGTMKGLISVGKNIINVTSQFEQTQKALETVTQSAEKGKKLFEDLRKFSFDTTFGVDELANASQQLLNVGVSTSVLKKDLKMLGDLAQGDKTKFQELTSIFAKIQSTGKASSMQLQQLALRGIPINKTLKEMGVTGTASAEKLTEAFEKLTTEGGQFNNAMGNIIDTIEGKKGFITDTIKEINVNFGELTGFTDFYKKILDNVYDILDAVNNKLMEWNENPAHQAIIRGVLVAGITALSVAIGVGLVGAIKTLNRNLAITATLKAIINPTAVALTVGISAIAGLAVALETATASANDYLNTVKEVDKLKDKYGVGDVNMSKARKNVDKGKATTKEKLAVAVENLQSSELRKKEYAIQVRDAKYEDVRKNAQHDLDYEEGIYQTLKKQVAELEEQLKKEEELAKKTQTREEYFQEMTDNFTAFTKKLGDAYDKYSDIGKKEKELQELIEDRAKLVADYNSKYFGLDENGNAVKLELDPESKVKYEKDIKALNDKYKQLKIEIKLKEVNNSKWKKTLLSSFGFTDEEVLEGAVDSGSNAVKKLQEKLEKSSRITKDFSDKGLINVSNLERAEQKLETINQKIKDIRDSGLWEADEGTVDDLKALQQSAINDVFTERMNKAKEELAIMQDQTGELQKQYELKMLTEQGFSIEQAQKLLDIEKEKSDFLLLQSDTWGYLTKKLEEFSKGTIDIKDFGEAFEKTLKEVAKTELPSMLVSGFESIGKALAEGADAGDAMKKQFAQMVAQMMKSLSTACVTAGVHLIADMGVAGIAPALGLFALGGVSGLASGFISSLSEGNSESDEQAKQLELLKSLNKQYEDLKDAMREQEEYYLKKKHELNMYSLSDRTTSVNDMIITPHGNFSTHPDDYVIATKNPQSLSGGVTNNIKVINNAGVDVDVSERRSENGMNEMLITLSKKIASDVANGYNGWDSAFAMQKQRVDGRRI